MRAPMERMSRSVARFVDVSGLRKVAQGFDWIARSATAVFRTLSAIVPVMGAITGAASIAGMIKLVGTYAAWSHVLVQNADDIGITTQQLQQFQDATRLAGGDASDMTSSLQALHTNLANMNIGQGNAAEVAQMLGSIGVQARDAGGHMRNMADIMPEVIAKIAALKDPADRARIATGLLGGEGSRLVESFRQSHQSFAQWFTDASRYTELTDQQKSSLQAFTEAQGRAATAFDHLGQQISIVLARDFGPLLNRLSEFVEKHTPEIVAAIDRISQKFVAWLQNVDWSQVQAGIEQLMQGLQFIFNHAEAIAILFATKWAIGMVASIAQVTTALGPLGAALAAIGALVGVWAGNKMGQQSIEDQAKGMGFEQKPGGWLGLGMPTFHNPTTGEDLTYEEMLKRQGQPYGGGGWLEQFGQRLWRGPADIQPQGSLAPPANLSLPSDTAARGGAINAQLASDLGLSSEQAAGITGNLQAESGLRAIQERNPLGGGAGGFGWAQWTGPRRAQFEAYAKEHNLDPTSDAANYGFLRQELNAPENADLMKQLRALRGPDTARQAAELVERQFERPASMADVGRRQSYAAQIAANTPTQVARAAPLPTPPTPPAPVTPPPAPPVAAPPAAAAPKGEEAPQQPPPQPPPVVVPPSAPPNSVLDVSITHKNPPPNSAVTATATGPVNVAPVRVEHQDMASI